MAERLKASTLKVEVPSGTEGSNPPASGSYIGTDHTIGYL